jgi:hypothetical protein
MKISKETKKIILNCGTRGCCPIMEINGENISIKDDYGNRIKVSKKQWDQLIEQYKNKVI